MTLDRTLPGLPFGLVAMDNARGIGLAVEHLTAQGHRRIGFVSWHPRSLSNRLERLHGYGDALAAAGIEFEPNLVRFAEDGWSDGVNCTLELFGAPDPPTAVISATSMLNLQVLAAVKRLGLRVPEDVSVVGYDDSPWDALLDPPLTTVATPARQLGVAAAERLVAALDAGERTVTGEVRLLPKLVIRESTMQAPSL